jgi:hypothetical protein
MCISYIHQIYSKNLKYKPVANFDLGPGFTHSREMDQKTKCFTHVGLILHWQKQVVNSGS